MLVDIKKASVMLSVSKETLRRWEKEGRITCLRTEGGHRRYDVDKLREILNESNVLSNKLVIGYCRVSSKKQEGDLERQIKTVEDYCSSRGYQFKIISDIGSGLNYKKKGLAELITLIQTKEISKIVVNYKDRLIRFGFEMIEHLCKLNHVDIEIINHTEDKTYNEELVDDVLSIITVYSAKLYGQRSHKQLKIDEESKKMFDIGKK
jgi:excisionase family DNA binding protein